MEFLAVLDVTSIALVVLVLAVVALVVRRRMLAHGGATFDCSLRLRAAPGGQASSWVWGVARYSGQQIDWFRALSYSMRPRLNLSRHDLTVRARRRLHGAEAIALLPAVVVVECEVDGRTVEFALSDEALTSLLAWLEAAPPGQGVSVA